MITSFLVIRPQHGGAFESFFCFLFAPFSPPASPSFGAYRPPRGGEDTEYIRNYYPIRELAQELGWSVKTIHQLAKTEGLPIHRAPGKERGAFIIRTEFDEWANKMGSMEGEK